VPLALTLSISAGVPTGWYSGNTVDLNSEKGSVRLSDESLSLLPEVSCCSQTLQANAGIVSRFGLHHVLPNPVQFIIHQSLYHPTLEYGLHTGRVVK
jgi:hypothetical protein